MTSTPSKDDEQREKELADKIKGETIAAIGASGFPFQLGIQKWVQANGKQWSAFLVEREFPWESDAGDASGYIDLVVSSNSKIFCAFECKKSKAGELIFLQPIEETAPAAFPILELASGAPSILGYTFCGEGALTGPWAEFCIFRDQKNESLLENFAADIALASETIPRLDDVQKGSLRYYLPVVVTNLPLRLCRFAASKVDLDTGFPGDSATATVDTVPFVRFQKCFPTAESLFEDIRVPSSERDRRESREPRFSDHLLRLERCVWVVNSQKLGAFLEMVLELGQRLPKRHFPEDYPARATHHALPS